MNVEIVVPSDQRALLPADAILTLNDPGMSLPAIGDFILLSPRSAWLVLARSWDLHMKPIRVRVQVEHSPAGLGLLPRPSLRALDGSPED